MEPNYIMRFFRQLLIRRQTKISSEAAIAILKEEALKREWRWIEPTAAHRHRQVWVVKTNIRGRGATVWGEVDCETGEIKYIGLAPR